MSTPAVKYTISEARTRVLAAVGTRGIPTAWWPLSTGNDCLGFQLERLGVRTASQLDAKHVSISAFRAWADWDEPGPGSLRAGDLICENWDSGQDAEHIEYLYSIDYSNSRCVIVSANTGPEPGVATPRGVWKKTRPLGDWLLFGIRPPYKGTVVSKARAATVRRVAAWLNAHVTGPDTSAAEDGIPGPRYWYLVQTWGRAKGIYGSTYVRDGIPGPRTEYVEAALIKQVIK